MKDSSLGGPTQDCEVSEIIGFRNENKSKSRNGSESGQHGHGALGVGSVISKEIRNGSESGKRSGLCFWTREELYSEPRRVGLGEKKNRSISLGS